MVFITKMSKYLWIEGMAGFRHPNNVVSNLPLYLSALLFCAGIILRCAFPCWWKDGHHLALRVHQKHLFSSIKIKIPDVCVNNLLPLSCKPSLHCPPCNIRTFFPLPSAMMLGFVGRCLRDPGEVKGLSSWFQHAWLFLVPIVLGWHAGNSVELTWLSSSKIHRTNSCGQLPGKFW